MTDLSVRGGKRSGLRLFSVFGIEIRLDVSVLIIFGLIVYSLGAGLLPAWHPEWGTGTIWGTALAAGLIFFVSLLAHELSHSLVAQRFGLRVPRITLFLFGGVAEIESEAKTPNAEFAIAIAGPLMSLALAVLFSVIAGMSIDEGVATRLLDDTGQGMAGIGPVVTACIWLSSVNFMLAVFNMLPGFPLDGGRVFRAVIWRVTGDYLRATRIASTTGRWLGWAIMAFGLWNLLALRNGGGLWLILIGWFLSYLAGASYAQQLMLRTLRPLKVRDVMETRFDGVGADGSVADFIENHLLRSRQSLWPVIDGDKVVGLISSDEAAAVPPADRARQTIRAVMSATDGRSLTEDMPATEALAALGASRDVPVAVMRDGRVTGLLRGSDILRWVTLRGQSDH